MGMGWVGEIRRMGVVVQYLAWLYYPRPSMGSEEKKDLFFSIA